MKKILIFSIISIFFIPISLFAAKEYTPLAPIGDYVTKDTPKDGLESYLGGMYRLGVGIATLLAVLMVIWGGVEYMTTDAWGQKEEGKERIRSALFGLLLALGSYIIIYTVDKSILDIDFDVLDKNKLSGEMFNPQPPEKVSDLTRSMQGDPENDNYDTSEVRYEDGGNITLAEGQVEVDYDGSPGAYRVVRDDKGKFTINGQRYRSVGIENLQNARSNDGRWVGVKTDGNGQPIIGPNGTLTGQLSYGNGTINGDRQAFVALSNQQIAAIRASDPNFKLGDDVLLTANGKTIRAIYADNAGNRGRNFAEASPAAPSALGVKFNPKGTDGTKVSISLPTK